MEGKKAKIAARKIALEELKAKYDKEEHERLLAAKRQEEEEIARACSYEARNEPKIILHESVIFNE